VQSTKFVINLKTAKARSASRCRPCCQPLGEDLRPAPLEHRKGKLEKLLARGDGIRFSEHLDGDGAIIFVRVCKLRLEGIISKRRELPYRSGRCKGWIEIKNPVSPAVLRIKDGTW
jgi:hypothetical protein